MGRPKSSKLPSGIRKRLISARPGFVYEINFYSRVHGQRFENAGTDLRAALRLRAQRLREVREGTYTPGTSNVERITVREYAEQWLKTRGDVITVDDDRTRLDQQILPVIGDLRVGEVETKHILGLLEVWRTKVSARGTPFGKNTIRNFYGIVVTFFLDAEQQGLTLRNPCAGVRKSQRPQKAPRHEVQGIAFTPEQVSRLISDERTPADRRVLYALAFLTGTRFGETAGLRWRDYDPKREPLGHLRVERQYEDQPLKGKRGQGGPPRDVPVHPTLAVILAEWKLGGFPALLGRVAQPDDFIVPSREGRCRSLRHSARKLAEDCARIGIEWKESTHVARRTFITLSMAGGASEAWLRRITHNASGDVLAGYQVNDWSAMCSAVKCVAVERAPSAGRVVALRRPTPTSHEAVLAEAAE